MMSFSLKNGFRSIVANKKTLKNLFTYKFPKEKNTSISLCFDNNSEVILVSWSNGNSLIMSFKVYAACFLATCQVSRRIEQYFCSFICQRLYRSIILSIDSIWFKTIQQFSLTRILSNFNCFTVICNLCAISVATRECRAIVKQIDWIFSTCILLFSVLW